MEFTGVLKKEHAKIPVQSDKLQNFRDFFFKICMISTPQTLDFLLTLEVRYRTD